MADDVPWQTPKVIAVDPSNGRDCSCYATVRLENGQMIVERALIVVTGGKADGEPH